jgi:multidrug efflux pump subunit AcrA (membrane-fusion protein)
MKRPILALIAVASLTFGIISVVRSQPRREATVPPSPPPVSGYEHTVAAVGLVESSTENISIGTPLSDVVTEVTVAAGQSVQVGDPMFKLDNRQRLADLAARRAELQVAESEVKVNAALLDDVTRQFNFVESLPDKSAISAEEFTHRRSAVETAQARLEEAKAHVTSAQAQIKVMETQVDRSIVRAPVDGEVLQVKIHPGEFAPAGVTSTPLILLGRLRPLHVRVDVDEHEAWRVRPEAKATASVRGNASLKTPLTFVRFEPFVLPKKSLTGDSTERVDTRVLQVIYRVEDENPRLFVGQQMDVFIDAEEMNMSMATR